MWECTDCRAALIGSQKELLLMQPGDDRPVAFSDSGEEGETERENSLTTLRGHGWLGSVSTAKTPTLLQWWGLQWSPAMDRQCGGSSAAPSLFPVKMRPPGNLQMVSKTENTYNLTWSLNISSHYLDGYREYQVRYRTTSQSWEVSTNWGTGTCHHMNPGLLYITQDLLLRTKPVLVKLECR